MLIELDRLNSSNLSQSSPRCRLLLIVDKPDSPSQETSLPSSVSYNYSTFRVTASNEATIKEDCPVCLICHQGINKGQVACRLSCNPQLHIFHKKCIDRWLEINDSCPLCKKPVREEKFGEGLEFPSRSPPNLTRNEMPIVLEPESPERNPIERSRERESSLRARRKSGSSYRAFSDQDSARRSEKSFQSDHSSISDQSYNSEEEPDQNPEANI